VVHPLRSARSKEEVALSFAVLTQPLGAVFSDPILNLFARHLGRGHRVRSGHLLRPEPYSSLFACVTDNEKDRTSLLSHFMQRWYRAMSNTQWYENHLSEYDEYYRYWCFEAAAVAKILNIQDDHLRDHPHYPYEARHG
jgi:hypothetical protein